MNCKSLIIAILLAIILIILGAMSKIWIWKVILGVTA